MKSNQKNKTQQCQHGMMLNERIYWEMEYHLALSLSNTQKHNRNHFRMTKNASDYLKGQQSGMSELVHAMREYTRTAEALHPYLSKEMQDHCVFSNIRDNIITYLTPLSAAASIIHYQIPDILLRIQQTQQFTHIKKIQCKIMHAFKNRIEIDSYQKEKMALISEDNSRIIYDHAQHLNDEALKKILIKISKHTK